MSKIIKIGSNKFAVISGKRVSGQAAKVIVVCRVLHV